MPPPASRRLVIDASVVLAAGTKSCRDFLQAVLEHGNHVVLTPEIEEEWKNAPPRLSYPRYPVQASLWRRAMAARRQIDRLAVAPKTELRRKVVLFASDGDAQTAMLEDFHLVEAALDTDKAIVSRDEEVRKLFIATALRMGEIREIVWVNPDKPAEVCLGWLANGAPDEIHRQLGFNLN